MEKQDAWWSERILFGLLIIVGYFSLVVLTFVAPIWIAVYFAAAKVAAIMPAVSGATGTVKDSLLVIGPLLGVIVTAIWKSDRTDKANAQAMSTLSTAVAAALPPAPDPAPPAPPPPPAPAPDAAPTQARAALLDPAGLPLAPVPLADLPAAEAELDVKDPAEALLSWGAKVSPYFRQRVRQIAAALSIPASWLMAYMAFETGRTFSPSIKNPHSSATGLIQFLEATAEMLGTTVQLLAAMSAEKQLDYVEAYFRKMVAAHGPIADLASGYMAILDPVAMNKSGGAVLWISGTSSYAVNAGLDTNKDHQITKGEAAARVAQLLNEGFQTQNVSS